MLKGDEWELDLPSDSSTRCLAARVLQQAIDDAKFLDFVVVPSGWMDLLPLTESMRAELEQLGVVYDTNGGKNVSFY